MPKKRRKEKKENRQYFKRDPAFLTKFNWEDWRRFWSTNTFYVYFSLVVLFVQIRPVFFLKLTYFASKLKSTKVCYLFILFLFLFLLTYFLERLLMEQAWIIGFLLRFCHNNTIWKGQMTHTWKRKTWKELAHSSNQSDYTSLQKTCGGWVEGKSKARGERFAGHGPVFSPRASTFSVF